MWAVIGNEEEFFLTKQHALMNAEYRLENIGGTIHVQKRNGDFHKTIEV